MPKCNGLYAWYFRNIPAFIPTDGCLKVNGNFLLYLGIAPDKANKPNSRATLLSRIRQHYGGNAENSTLRRTLGVLLSGKSGLRHTTGNSTITFVTEAVCNKVSLLASDSWPGYKGLPTAYPHASVDHHKHQYVVGAVHTNTIEGFWSIFKRGVVGTFHKVSAKYLPLYVAEFQFRYNNRMNSDIFGAVICGC